MVTLLQTEPMRRKDNCARSVMSNFILILSFGLRQLPLRVSETPPNLAGNAFLRLLFYIFLAF